MSDRKYRIYFEDAGLDETALEELKEVMDEFHMEASDLSEDTLNGNGYEVSDKERDQFKKLVKLMTGHGIEKKTALIELSLFAFAVEDRAKRQIN